MTTATEAPVETQQANIAAAPAANAATSGQPAGGVAAPAVVAVAGTPPAAPAAAAAPAAKPGLLAETDPKGAETAKLPAITDTKPVEITLKAPEGLTVADETLRAVEAFAKESGLTQAQAEKILAREVKGRTEAETSWKTSQAAEVAKVADVWRAEAEKHPEIGGDKLPVAIADAKRALAVYATPEERKAIADSPFANNPMFIAIMSRAAKGLPAEDAIHAAGAGKSHATSGPQVLYPMYYK